MAAAQRKSRSDFNSTMPRNFVYIRTERHGLPIGLAPVERRPSRRSSLFGFTLLELEVALLILGVAIAGLFPLLNMHSKALRSLEKRLPSSGTWYLVPSSDTWARKLGAGASITDVDPGPKPTSPVLSGDDGDACYAEADLGWVADSNPLAYQADSRRHAAPPEGSTPTGTNVATWTFTSVIPGWYQVEATWPEASDQTDAACYTIYDGETSTTDALVDQRNAPAGPLDDGRPWQTLSTQFVRNSTVRVQLDGEATSGYVVADGMRLVPLENRVQVLSLDKSSATEDVTANVSVEVLVPH